MLSAAAIDQRIGRNRLTRQFQKIRNVIRDYFLGAPLSAWTRGAPSPPSNTARAGVAITKRTHRFIVLPPACCAPPGSTPGPQQGTPLRPEAWPEENPAAAACHWHETRQSDG